MATALSPKHKSPKEKENGLDSGFVGPELWKDHLLIREDVKDNSEFENTLESATFVWEISELPKGERGTLARIEFETNLCNENTKWNIVMNYNPKMKCALIFILMHSGRSASSITPGIEATFYKDNKVIDSVSENNPKSSADKNWDLWEFPFKNDETEPPITKIIQKFKYTLKIHLTISYNVKAYNELKKFWYSDKFEPFVDLEKTIEERKKEADLIVVAGNKDEFYVERELLSMRSEYFFSIYKHEIIGDTHRLEINDVDGKVVCEMIRFIYTGKVNDLDKYVYDLLILADRYKIIMLKHLCEHELAKNLSLSNMHKIIETAEKYHLDELKERIGDYLCNSLTKEFKDSLKESVVEDIVCGIYSSL